MDRVKIAILNQPQDPIVAGEEQRGSVAIVNWELARRLAERHEGTIYAPRAPGQPLLERWNGIEIRRMRHSAKRIHKAVQLVAGRLGGRRPYAFSPLYHREYYLQVARDLRRQPAEIVHFPVQLQAAQIFKRAVPSAKTVLHVHQDELAQLDADYVRRHLSVTDAVVTVSEFVTHRARERFPEFAARIHTIGNGVDVMRFQPLESPATAASQAGSSANPPGTDHAAAARRPTRLLFVGRVAPDKGVHLLFKAFDTLARQQPDLELTLVGKPGMMPFDVMTVLLQGDAGLEAIRPFYGRSVVGWLTKEVIGQRNSYLDHLRGLLSPQTAPRMRFRGTVPLQELLRLYRETDLLVLPSIWQESYGLPIAEAMASGVPVLATASGGVPELIEEGITGRLVPRMDLDALTDAMRDLLSDPARLRNMGRAARLRAERLLTWERSAQRLESVYLGLATSRPSVRPS